MLNTQRKLLLNLKNIPGWTTKRKIVIFSVDDYGSIRVASALARKKLKEIGLNMDGNRFDQYDALENKEDLTMLYEILTSVKDQNGRSASFSAFSLSANIDFEAVIESNYSKYYYELLPQTLQRLPGYEGTWDLWREGITNRLLVPQFHGREHFNLKFFNELLSSKNPELLACLENQSYAGIKNKPFENISYMSAFSFEEFEENENHKQTITDGLNTFEQVFGYRATNFIAPGTSYHKCLEKTLFEGGIHYIDANLIDKEYQGEGKYKLYFNYLGKKNSLGQIYLIRNSVFEPLLNTSLDWVDYCLSEIEIAFRWNKPANISTHRVNFAGHIEPKIREHGLSELKRLLKAMTRKWPDIEFMTSNELGDLISLKT